VSHVAKNRRLVMESPQQPASPLTCYHTTCSGRQTSDKDDEHELKKGSWKAA